MTDSTHTPQSAAPRTSANERFLEGERFLSSGDFLSAERCFRDVSEQEPNRADAAANLGYVLDKLGRAEEGEKHLRRALELDPDCPEAALNLGALLTTTKRFAEAERVCMKAVTLRPLSPQAWSNLGVLYAELKREAEAEQSYRTAMSLDRKHPASRFNLSYLLLRQGRYEEGWQCFEARSWYAGFAERIPCLRWRGEPLAGKSILIAYEAGHGDMIQFIRYASVLREQQPRAIEVICHPALKTLFAAQKELDRVFAFNESIANSGWDYWTPPLSMPYYCQTRLDTIPARIPYLHAPADRLELWRTRLPPERPRVGLAWKGNPAFENDPDRSLPSLNTLAPLGDVADIHFISLQKGAGEDEAGHPPGRLRLVNIGPQCESFGDSAAVISQLDLVISVDTAVAHLAGALGIPCWILLPYYKTDWRWLADREDSPWYPGVMRLFRQTRMGEWSDVVEKLHHALETWVRTLQPQAT